MRGRSPGHDESRWELETIWHARELETKAGDSRGYADGIVVTVVGALRLAVALLLGRGV